MEGGSPEEADGQRRVTPERRSPERVRRRVPPHPLGDAASAHFFSRTRIVMRVPDCDPGVDPRICFMRTPHQTPGASPGVTFGERMALFQGDALGCRRGEALIFDSVDFALVPGDALWL